MRDGFGRLTLRAVVILAWVPSAVASPNHDELQFGEVIQISWQQYSSRTSGGGRRLNSESQCENVARKPWELLRIGYQVLDAADVPAAHREHIERRILARAVEFWSRALRVHRVQEPLRAEYVGENCAKYGLAFKGQILASEGHYTCEKAKPPVCGPHGLEIPRKYLKTKRVCSKNCPNVFETFSHLLKADRVCDNCTELPQGVGAVGYDFFVFVTIKDDFCEGDVQAHATTCVKDQCDRPIFGLINFCKSKISVREDDVDRQVTTAVHELAHALAFSAHHFQFFRNPDGSPMWPRNTENPSVLVDSTPWSCRSDTKRTSYRFPDKNGGRRYVDLSKIGVLAKFNERGINNCQCPIGQETMGQNCILPPQPAFRAPACVLRLTTPKVAEKVREFFGCPSLEGAELENQPTSPCIIVSSHWEQRAFMGEVMVSAQVIQPTFLSEVTLALFQDSGWYLPDYGMADPLVKGVHWGFKQGCDFATKPCVQGGKSTSPRFWCTSSQQRTCSSDRVGEVQCSIEPPGKDLDLPPALRYGNPPFIGFVAEADYCPFFHVRISNHECTNPDSTTFPVSNVNFERELFGYNSRCFESTLRADVIVPDGRYDAQDGQFRMPQPRCYEVRCKTKFYEVWISDSSGGRILLGQCWSEGQKLGVESAEGHVICGTVEELCDIRRATHLGPPSGASDIKNVIDEVILPAHETTQSSDELDSHSRFPIAFVPFLAPLIFALILALFATNFCRAFTHIWLVEGTRLHWRHLPMETVA